MGLDDQGREQVARIGQAVEHDAAQPVRAVKGRGHTTVSGPRSFGQETFTERWGFEVHDSYLVTLHRGDYVEPIAQAETLSDARFAIAEYVMDQADE